MAETEVTFLTQGIKLETPKSGTYTAGDKVIGLVHFDPLRKDRVTEVDLSLYGSSDPDWDTDGDDSKSETGLLTLNITLYSGAPVVHKNFPFEFTFPALTNHAGPSHEWAPNHRFEHGYGHPLPPTWEGDFDRIRYRLTARIVSERRGTTTFTRKIKYTPSKNASTDSSWIGYTCTLFGFFRSARLNPTEGLEEMAASDTVTSNQVIFRFPKVLVSGEDLLGSISVRAPSSEQLKLWYLIVDINLKKGIRTLGNPAGQKPRPAYRPARLLCSFSPTILPNEQPTDLLTLCKSLCPVPPFYTFKTFNIYVAGYLQIKALFTSSSGKLYRLASSDVPVSIVGPPGFGNSMEGGKPRLTDKPFLIPQKK
ncbi:uncharacterized protein TRUGW13939_06929 [Talaromyces rugulosus]|uniref:Uncharacterized protein n=1 Tax=Talaromyces rugulosus TaxID=121627 RepID=A0A7H8R0Q6_TALRU|nr:uncharacterized protein TRUGW13939_06929 [Talaromyces rugulosus]QKX59787.1 hypothetical protein TRUGW13939_06929 [Talaromyces rugulosus]